MNKYEIVTCKGIIRQVKGILSSLDKKLDENVLHSDDHDLSELKEFSSIVCRAWLRHLDMEKRKRT
jgi:hypothetical protein